MSELLERVLLHEGFREKPYLDTLGVSTFGHGLTYITRDESEEIVRVRLVEIERDLVSMRSWLIGHPPAILDVLTEMVFQLGMSGLNKFKKMWAALEEGNYTTAAAEGLDSLWAKQTPGRAEELMNIVRGFS